jgi:hypothetical protein
VETEAARGPALTPELRKLAAAAVEQRNRGGVQRRKRNRRAPRTCL